MHLFQLSTVVGSNRNQTSDRLKLCNWCKSFKKSMSSLCLNPLQTNLGLDCLPRGKQQGSQVWFSSREETLD